MIYSPRAIHKSQIINNLSTRIQCLPHCHHNISIKKHFLQATATCSRLVVKPPIKIMTAYQNEKPPLTTTLLSRLQTRANRGKSLRLHSINTMSLIRVINKQCSFSRHRSQKHIRNYIMLVCTRRINLRFKTTTQKQRKTLIHIQLLHQDPWDPIITVEIWTSLSKRVNSILRLQNCHSKKSRTRGGWIQRYYQTLPI